jgi:hypothetical protein
MEGGMARGWASKAVESQQEDRAAARVSKPALSVAERERRERRQSLELALAQTQAELGAACRPMHREMLQARLKAIRESLDGLS